MAAWQIVFPFEAFGAFEGELLSEINGFSAQNIAGGEIQQADLFTYDRTTVTVSDGLIDISLTAYDDSNITVSGDWTQNLYTNGDSILNMIGGTVNHT